MNSDTDQWQRYLTDCQLVATVELISRSIGSVTLPANLLSDLHKLVYSISRLDKEQRRSVGIYDVAICHSVANTEIDTIVEELEAGDDGAVVLSVGSVELDVPWEQVSSKVKAAGQCIFVVGNDSPDIWARPNVMRNIHQLRDSHTSVHGFLKNRFSHAPDLSPYTEIGFRKPRGDSLSARDIVETIKQAPVRPSVIRPEKEKLRELVLDEFEVEGRSYFLRQPLSGEYDSQSQSVTFPDFKLFAGEGSDAQSAVVDLQNKVDARFQILRRKTQEELDDSEREEWNLLSSTIDVPRTLGSWPVRVKQTVEILSADPWRVQPVGGIETELALQNAPAGFENLKAGDWITATCVYDGTTHKRVEIAEMEQREPMAELSAEQAEEFLRTMRKTSELPSLEWDDI